MKKAIILVMAVWAAAAAVPGDNAPQDTPDRSMEEIRNKVEDIKDTVESSYGLLLAEEPELSGEIDVSFSITPEGEITSIEVVCSEGLGSLEEPVTDAVSAMVFDPCPGQDENIPVTVPFSLFPPEGE